MQAGSVLLAGMFMWHASVMAATTRISDIRNTKHNFSATVTPHILGGGDTRTVKATSEGEICVFCHTPHGANTAEGPLWNRQLPDNATYTKYSSGSIDSTINQPNGVSKLCLSCHDGTIAIGKVRNLRATFDGPNIAMTGTGTNGVMAPGAGGTSDPNTGYTRFLGTDLTNDHPISMTYNQALVSKDMEMRDPASGTAPIRVRGLLPKPGIQDIQLQPENQASPSLDTGQVQCISCHDPHIRSTTNENIKFLRLNRLQKNSPPSGSNSFNATNDIICLACHEKAGWAGSAHASPSAANETYTNAAADVREFPRGTAVWETACLTCHDTHAVQGSRRLLRDGTDATTMNYLGYNIKRSTGSNVKPAVEENCYACHSPNRGTLNGQGGANFEVPDTWSDFQLPRHMPITSGEQIARTEMHNIGGPNPDTSLNGQGKDFIEDPNNMGRNNLNNRHAECTDCHNPHRVVKRQVFYQNNFNGADNEPTHSHTQPHSNIASGVLRGIWGVEPGIFGIDNDTAYPSASFHVDPVAANFIVKRGDPGNSTNTAKSAPYLTREYQLCFKCHSNYAYPGGYGGPLALGSSTGFMSGTPSGTNAMKRYTNQAREFNSPNGHEGEPKSAGTAGGAGSAYNNNNHRSWHPVMRETSRTPSARGIGSPNIWLPPFRAVGAQTMYCTDCHGTNTANGSAVPTGGANGNPWGPHGSENNFLLKGPWSGNRVSNTDGTGIPGTGTGAQNHLCFKCHDYAQYADPNNNAPLDSGFQLGGGTMMGGMGGGGMGGGGGGGGCMGGGAMCMGMMTAGMNNLHIFHANQVSTFRCNLCHVAVPHGWKNKVFLVNLNDVGPEGGYTQPRQVRYVGDGTPTVPCGGGGGGMGGGGGNCAPAYFRRDGVDSPYYNRAALKVASFAASGNWQPSNCGSAGAPGNGVTGVGWMAGSDEACNNLP